MLLRRFGRPGLIGTMARTAVVAGTATAVVGGMQNHRQAKAQAEYDQQQAQQQLGEMQDQMAAMQAQQAAAPPAAAPQGAMLTELTKLGELKQSGLLTDAEFTAAKAKLLAS